MADRFDDEDERRPRKSRRDDDDDDEDRTRKSGKKKTKDKAGNQMLLILLLGGGGVLALFACCGAGVVGYFLLGFDSPNIIGRWQNDNGLLRTTYEFRKDRTGTSNVGNIDTDFKYRLSGDELTIDPTGPQRINGNPFGGQAPILRYRVTREGDRLFLDPILFVPMPALRVSLRRV
jgi:hypothetical protein